MGKALSVLYIELASSCVLAVRKVENVCVSCGENWVKIREKGSIALCWVNFHMLSLSNELEKRVAMCSRMFVCDWSFHQIGFRPTSTLLCCLPLRKGGFARHVTAFTHCVLRRERGKGVTFTQFQRHVAVTIWIWWKSKKSINEITSGKMELFKELFEIHCHLLLLWRAEEESEKLLNFPLTTVPSRATSEFRREAYIMATHHNIRTNIMNFYSRPATEREQKFFFFPFSIPFNHQSESSEVGCASSETRASKWWEMS